MGETYLIELKDEIHEVSKELYVEYYQGKELRKLRYMEYDLKNERIKIDLDKQVVKFIPSREDSFERLLEKDLQFANNEKSIEDIIIMKIEIKRLYDAIKQLSAEEREVIEAIFYNGKSERKFADEKGIPRMTLHDYKVRILAKLKKLMEI